MILLHGPDHGLIGERARAIVDAALDNPDDPFQLVRLEGDEIASDPARLADEANTIGLFGGRRVLWVKLGGKSILSAVEPLSREPARDSLIVLEAGDLKKTHALRQLCEKSPAIATIVCYGDESVALIDLARSVLAKADLKTDQQTLELIVAALGADRAASRGELDKLALYAHGRGVITAEDVEAVLADVAMLDTATLIDATFEGRLSLIESLSRRLFAEGQSPDALIGQALRHAFLLKRLIGLGAQDRLDHALVTAGIYFKRHESARRQIFTWREGGAIDRAILLLSQGIADIRRTPRLAEALAVRMLWSVARGVRRRAAS